MKKLHLIAVTAVGLIASATSSQAALTWNFNYVDPEDGTGFYHSTEANARKDAVQATADIVSGWFMNYTATLDIDVIGYNKDESTLASAGSQFNKTPSSNGFGGRGDVGLKILGGADPLTGAYVAGKKNDARDGEINVNWFWQWDLSDSVAADKQDFKSTLAHELIHAIGFSSDIGKDGKSGYGADAGTPTKWAPFDEFVSDSNGALIDSSGTLDGTRWTAAAEGGTGTSGLFFNGTQAKAANGGKAVNLYSPTSWEDGSSGSHLDTDFFTSDDLLMEHASGDGPGTRTLSAIELGILKDIGFTNVVSAVPEPSTFAAIGLGGLGLLYMNRRRNAKKNIAA